MSGFSRQACQAYQDFGYNTGVTSTPELHPFDPKSNWRTWVPASYTPDTWPTFEAAPVGNHLHTATVSHLYRFFDADKALLYIGVTTNPGHRWQVHRGNRWWWSIRFVSLEPVDPATRLHAEQAAIRAEKPRFNVAVYTPRTH